MADALVANIATNASHGRAAAAAGFSVVTQHGSIADIVMVVLIGLLLLGICLSLILHCYFELGRGAKET
ncbi:hypothetical protein AAVH_38901, partial [Aphelenchoides avenae]